jgi:hypothetical protein
MVIRPGGWCGVWLAAAWLGCGASPAGDDPGDEPAPGGDLTGGVLATFVVSGEEFRVWVTNTQTIVQILDLRDGTSLATIPNGALRVGPGPGDHNSPWGWHMDPEDIQMAELTIEVCDGRPSLVDSMLDQYLAIGRFCPWGAVLVAVEDRRQAP